MTDFCGTKSFPETLSLTACHCFPSGMSVLNFLMFGLQFLFCSIWRGWGDGELFQDEPIVHWKVESVKNPSLYSGLMNTNLLSLSWAEGSVKQLHDSNCLAQDSESTTQMTLPSLWERDWLTIDTVEESFALLPVTCFSCLWHLADFCFKCA